MLRSDPASRKGRSNEPDVYIRRVSLPVRRPDSGRTIHRYGGRNVRRRDERGDHRGSARPGQSHACFPPVQRDIPQNRPRKDLRPFSRYPCHWLWRTCGRHFRPAFESSTAASAGSADVRSRQRASGNLATEDLVLMLSQCGYETGIDVEGLRKAIKLAEELVKRPLGGRDDAVAGISDGIGTDYVLSFRES